MAQLKGLSNIRPIYMRKKKAADCTNSGLHKTRTGPFIRVRLMMRLARINGSRLIRDLCLVFVLVVIAFARTLARAHENLAAAYVSNCLYKPLLQTLVLHKPRLTLSAACISLNWLKCSIYKASSRLMKAAACIIGWLSSSRK